MPGNVIQDKWIDAVPRGFKLPPELTNPDAIPETKQEIKPEVKTAEPPKEESKQIQATGETQDAKADQEDTDKIPDATSAEDGRAKKEQDWRERRMYRAQRHAAEAQARAELREKENAELRAKLEARDSPKTSTTDPRMEDFTDIGEFKEAVTKHVRESTIKEIEDKQKNDVYKAAELKLTQDWNSSVEKASSKYDDWDDVVGDLDNKFPMNIAIKQEENGADIAYYLGKNRKEVDRILGLNPGGQFREIGKLSVKLQAPVDKPKTPSAAPKPISPVNPEAKPGGDSIRENQPYEEYRKVGNKMFSRGRQL